MTIVAADIMSRYQRIAQDDESIRWPLLELRDWLNDAIRSIMHHKPNAHPETKPMVLVAGCLQTAPTGTLHLIRINRNLKTNSSASGGRTIRPTQKAILDAQHPDWSNTTYYPAATVVKHYMFDPADPLHFMVFPASSGGNYVEIVVSTMPAIVPLPANPGDYEEITAYAIAIDLPDTYFNALLYFVLHRGYLKDATFNGSGAQRAAAYLEMFANELGVKMQMEAIANPNMGVRVEETPQNPAPLTATVPT